MTPEPDEQSPATRQLESYLGTLREDQPRSDPDLVPHIVRRARWQRTIRTPLRAVGSLLGALADGLEAFLGPSQRRSR